MQPGMNDCCGITEGLVAGFCWTRSVHAGIDHHLPREHRGGHHLTPGLGPKFLWNGQLTSEVSLRAHLCGDGFVKVNESVIGFAHRQHGTMHHEREDSASASSQHQEQTPSLHPFGVTTSLVGENNRTASLAELAQEQNACLLNVPEVKYEGGGKH
eukprot:5604266-Amphidinium_carterae.1